MRRLNEHRAITEVALDSKGFGSGQRTFSEEASTLGFHGVYRLWDDAADEGVWVRSRIGLMLAFALTEVQRDREGDIQAWKFEFSDRQRVRWPGSPGPLALIIWND
jgi:hypothetical protein